MLGKNHNIIIAYKFLENVANFKYVRMTITNQNCIHEEIKNRLNLGSACYHAAHNSPSSRLISISIKIKIYKIIISLVILHGCETLPFTLTL
jgi:hypothetical protein